MFLWVRNCNSLCIKSQVTLVKLCIVQNFLEVRFDIEVIGTMAHISKICTLKHH